MSLMKKFTHGGNIYKVAKEYGMEEEKILDFSANINPLGPSPLAVESIINNLSLQQCYPDPDYCELRNEISKYLNVASDYIIVGNGATELIYLFFRSMRPRKVLIPVPTFSEYERAARLAGCEICYLPLNEEDGFSLSPQRLVQNLEGVSALVLCNPNNPTGVVLPRNEVEEVVKFCNRRGILVLIDEAFMEFVHEMDCLTAIDLLDEFRNVMVVRAFTKFFGMPGVRLGYGITKSAEILEGIRSFKEPWSVNVLAAVAGVAALKDEDYIQKSKAIIQRERKYLLEELSKIGWLKPFETKANFILIKILDENISSSDLRMKLIPHGILIRDASNFVGLSDRFIRVAVKDRRSNDILISALKRCREETQ